MVLYADKFIVRFKSILCKQVNKISYNEHIIMAKQIPFLDRI